jgi:uncharacterized protein YndB with AHSA1/START domain
MLRARPSTGGPEEERHVRLSAEIRYDAGPQQVFRMIVDPAFQEAKCAATGSVEHEVDVSPHDDGGATVFSRRTMPTDHIPEVVRAFLGATVKLHETQRWDAETADGARTGSIVVEIEGVPVRFTGSMALTPDGGGTHQPIEGEIKASLPLFGSRIESAAEPAVLAAIRVEQRTGTAWLAAH